MCQLGNRNQMLLNCTSMYRISVTLRWCDFYRCSHCNYSCWFCEVFECMQKKLYFCRTHVFELVFVSTIVRLIKTAFVTNPLIELTYFVAVRIKVECSFSRTPMDIFAGLHREFAIILWGVFGRIRFNQDILQSSACLFHHNGSAVHGTIHHSLHHVSHWLGPVANVSDFEKTFVQQNGTFVSPKLHRDIRRWDDVRASNFLLLGP